MEKSVSATITGANEFTEWLRISPVRAGEKVNAGLRIGDNTTFSATVTLQTKAPSEGDAAAADIETYTTAQRKTLEFVEEVDVRVGVKNGDFTSGTIPVSITTDPTITSGAARTSG